MPSVIVNLEEAEVLSKLRDMQKDAETAVERMMKDIKSRGPTWIAKGVSEKYNIAASKVKGGGLVKLNISGGGLGDLVFTYRGRMLTPTHFKMTPTAPKPGAYTIKATILKGKRATIGKVKKITKKQRKNIGRNFHRQGMHNSPESPPMLMYTGNKKAGGTNYIPFQRTKQPGNFDKAIKTTSIPQMIKDGSGNLKPAVKKQLTENVEKRFMHYAGKIL